MVVVRGPYVAVIGPGEATPEQVSAAREVGGLLAARGATVVSGGLGGVMAASCRGAVENGGSTLGLLPGRDRTEGNAYLTVSVPTGMGELRNGLVVAAADGIIAIGGGWGTLSEIALAMRTGKPLIAMGSPQLIAQGDPHTFPTARTPSEAVTEILHRISALRTKRPTT
ncbi:TIGR00725 family protein [Actinocorallia aurea]